MSEKTEDELEDSGEEGGFLTDEQVAEIEAEAAAVLPPDSKAREDIKSLSLVAKESSTIRTQSDRVALERDMAVVCTLAAIRRIAASFMPDAQE
jgi:trimethylamine:corrinoid methyltransferase-like protein